MEFIEAFREKMPLLREYLANSKFGVCANVASDLVRSSEFSGYAEGIFVGEIFEALFAELRSLAREYEVKKEDTDKIKAVINPAINFLEDNIPITDKDKKAELYSLLVTARSVVTTIQLTYWREKERRPRVPLFSRTPAIIEAEE